MQLATNQGVVLPPRSSAAKDVLSHVCVFLFIYGLSILSVSSPVHTLYFCDLSVRPPPFQLLRYEFLSHLASLNCTQMRSSLTLFLPDEDVGAILGRKGQNLVEIQSVSEKDCPSFLYCSTELLVVLLPLFPF